MIDQVGDRNRLTVGEDVETTLAARQLGLAPAWAPNVWYQTILEEAGKPSMIMSLKCARLGGFSAAGCARYERGRLNLLVAVYVARAITENFADSHPNYQLRLGVFSQQRIVVIDARGALNAQSVWLFEIDEQHAHLGVPDQVTHRIEHAVAVIAGKREGLAAEDANESWIAALVGDSRSSLVIYG
jgi:hypothetical protein